MIKKISVIVPCFNEIRTIERAIQALLSVDFHREKEIIIVDDGSTDGTREYLEKFHGSKEKVAVLFHEKNKGKGSAIRTALRKATGDYIIVQDADLEYDPHDIVKLIESAEKNNALVAYGSRNKDIKNKYLYPHYYWGSKILTWFINFLYGQKITDPETCYKFVETNLMRFIDVQERGFGVEMEVTLKIIKLGIPIVEEPISYSPRGFKEGKKIKTKDGLWALYLIIWHTFHDMHFGPVDGILRYLRVRSSKPFLRDLKGKNMLDVGCGRQGYLGWKYKNILLSYSGLDSIIVESSIQNLNFIQDDVKNLALRFSGKKFDIITALAIIEHIDEPQKFIMESYELLSPQGLFIITTPAPVAHPILHFISSIGIINKEEIDCHKQYFTLEKISEELRQKGFTIVYKKRFLFGLNSVVVGKRA